MGSQGRCPETTKCSSTSWSSSQNSGYSSICFTFFFYLDTSLSHSFLLPSDMSRNLRHTLQTETWIAASLGSCVWVAALGAITEEVQKTWHSDLWSQLLELPVRRVGLGQDSGIRKSGWWGHRLPESLVLFRLSSLLLHGLSTHTAQGVQKRTQIFPSKIHHKPHMPLSTW